MFWRIAPLIFASVAVLVGFRSDDATVVIDKELIRKGQIAWAKSDERGRSCIGCHSPQGLELAFFDFDDEDIVRRAEAHVSADDAQAIVGMIHARRRQYKIYKPLDSMADRPLQPGGQVLRGETPAERDLAFAQEIDSRLPLLTRGNVDSLSKAREAAKQVLAIDLNALRIGIGFNHLSEDGFHGLEHATVADWIPDTPVELPPAALKARDQYRQDPSDENLTNLVREIPTELPRGTIAQQLALAKYRALLRLQAQFANPNRNELGPKFKFDNPYWDVAETARSSRGMPLKQFGLPDDIRLKKEPGPPSSQQLGSMMLPWYWVGWMCDNGLQHTTPSDNSRTALYFGFELFDNGPYPMHCAFMFLRKQLSEAFQPGAWSRKSPQHYVMEYSSFLGNGNFERYTPSQSAASSLYRSFVVNEYRTSLYLLLDETQRTHTTDLKKPELAESRQMADYVEAQVPKSKQAMETLLAQIKKAFAAAEQLRD